MRSVGLQEIPLMVDSTAQRPTGPWAVLSTTEGISGNATEAMG